ncbi:MAG: hypothetical protein CTY10_03450 [Methylotenera sp.]|nr:MAG: hypothetical protein CTY10_03450 [Methylotenera sp.]
MKEFGFLQYPLEASFLNVKIQPINNHSEGLEWLKKNTNKDGYFYPPQFATYTIDSRTGKTKTKVENSDRPARVYHIPSSHKIEIENPVCIQNEPFTDEALIVYLLAYLYGTRLQISDWKFEGRIPIKPVNNISITEDAIIHFLSHVYNWWRKLTQSQRTKFANILYVHNRANSLEWDWDMFLHQYMVFDALYALHSEFNPPAQTPKLKERLNILCREYSIDNADLINDIYKARNELFHEAMWVEFSTIGFGSSNQNAYQLPHHLI